MTKQTMIVWNYADRQFRDTHGKTDPAYERYIIRDNLQGIEYFGHLQSGGAENVFLARQVVTVTEVHKQ